ncbi:MAG: pentapeptide repeat-containing protein [Anaerolineaceae bacterium]|jgi:uncharacterized protein YjbI with pentapeptide repeats|nr:pentapeptide repeat-containing protein [Anaerolineaceae bacterium]
MKKRKEHLEASGESKKDELLRIHNEKKGVIDALLTYFGLDDAIALLALLLGLSYYFYQFESQFLYDFHAELISIGITVLILGNANQYMEIQTEKRQLILQMGSPANNIAIEAVRQLRQRGWLNDGTLKGVIIWKSNLENGDLQQAILKGANLTETNLNGADLFQANLDGAILEETQLKGALLQEASLMKADLIEANLEGASLIGAWLMMADLTMANLKRASLDRADLFETILRKANLQEADLSEANLRRADLSDANLHGADLSNSDLSYANLCGADLSGVSVTTKVSLDKDILNIGFAWNDFDDETIWTGAIYNIGIDGTKFPDSFNPIEKGMICV